MFDKLMQAQQQAEEIKKKLKSISVSGEVEGGKIKVIATADKQIRDIVIDAGFFKSTDQEELSELLVVALNKALENAEQVNQREMASAAQSMFGGLGGMFK